MWLNKLDELTNVAKNIASLSSQAIKEGVSEFRDGLKEGVASIQVSIAIHRPCVLFY